MTNLERGLSARGASRREILRLGAGGAGVCLLGPLARRGLAAPRFEPTTTPKLVIVELRGGNDGLNTVVPNHLAAYFARRPNIALPETETLSMNAGPHADTDHRLHPSLGYMAQAWADGDLAVLRKVGYPDANGSHFESERIYARAVRGTSGLGNAATNGWIARFAEEVIPSPTGCVAVGAGLPEAFQGGSTALLSLGGSLSSFAYEVDGRYGSTNDPHRKETVQRMLAQYQGSELEERIKTALEQGHELEAQVAAAEESYASPVVYPVGSSLATSLQSVAKLMQAGFDSRIFYVAAGGYDTHGGQLGVQAGLHTRMDEALAAFAEDVTRMGVWWNTVVLVVSEFGRRNFQNGSGGTDHGEANTWLALGGAVQGGLFGPALTEADLQSDNVAYEVDFRSVYEEIVRTHLNVVPGKAARIFPEPVGQPTTLGFV